MSFKACSQAHGSELSMTMGLLEGPGEGAGMWGKERRPQGEYSRGDSGEKGRQAGSSQRAAELPWPLGAQDTSVPSGLEMSTVNAPQKLCI